MVGCGLPEDADFAVTSGSFWPTGRTQALRPSVPRPQTMPSGSRFESMAADILANLGFTDVLRAARQSGYDLIAKKGGFDYAVEVKGVSEAGYFSVFNLRWGQLQALARASRQGKRPLVAMLNNEGRGIIWEPFHISMKDDEGQEASFTQIMG